MKTLNNNNMRYSSALVLGLGASGESAARLLAGEGTAVTVVDSASGPGLDMKVKSLARDGIQAMPGVVNLPAGPFEICITSPGVPVDGPWITSLAARGIPVVSELELGWSRTRCPTLAITGSNGKSTMVKFCFDMLKRAGFTTCMAGNWGEPLCAVAPGSGKLDWVVAEVSSFQLETSGAFRPEIAVLLNLFPNHLDRHPDMETYTAMKMRIFAGQGVGDTAIVPCQWAGRLPPAGDAARRIWTFGSEDGADFIYRRGSIQNRVKKCGTGCAAEVKLEGTMFDNEVMGLTAAASAAVAEAIGIGAGVVSDVAVSFEPLSHRMQTVAVVNGVEFVDDSKATNLGAMSAALKLARGPVRLIAGGLLKENDLSWIKGLLSDKVVGAYLVGQAAQRMADAWSGTVPCSICGDVAQALECAWSESSSGETVLLSPACASFDQFRSYGERGDLFATAVKALARRCENN